MGTEKAVTGKRNVSPVVLVLSRTRWIKQAGALAFAGGKLFCCLDDGGGCGGDEAGSPVCFAGVRDGLGAGG